MQSGAKGGFLNSMAPEHPAPRRADATQSPLDARAEAAARFAGLAQMRLDLVADTAAEGLTAGAMPDLGLLDAGMLDHDVTDISADDL